MPGRAPPRGRPAAMTGNAGAVPLVSIDAVVLDTETTGLDAAAARLLQLGAVRLKRGRLAEDETFTTLVDPGVPVPPDSTRIHGITDKDVAGAPAFPTAWQELTTFRRGAVLIGHSIGFDLAILKRECEFAGLGWEHPRTLDTRFLGRVARPSLSDHSLDALAAWLEIPIHDRHTALGDAFAAARVFIALLPFLRERGVRTLAEAEAASRNLTNEILSLQSAGWEEPVTGPEQETEQVLERIDSYPYRHRVRDIMNVPPVFVTEDTGLKEAVALLIEREVSSVFVRCADGGTGIVTERDVLRAIARHGMSTLARTAGSFMSTPLQTVRADAFIYRAIARMDRLGVRHLGVVDEVGDIVGALTLRNLLRQRASAALVLGDEIDFAATVADLGAAWGRLPGMAEQLLAEEVDARDIAAVISREICAITRRAAELAETRMDEAGRGGPPCPYAVLVLGSAGRGESLFAADQDNAIIYKAASEDGAEDRWFAEMAEHLADTLDAVGIPYCTGGVMAKNRPWRHTVAGWREAIDDWIRRSRPEDLLNVDIFYDMRAVHGDVSLAIDVRTYAFEQGGRVPSFMKLLAQTTGEYRPPFGMFGGLRTENGRIDLKRGGLLPVVTTARVLAIRHGIMGRATRERLTELRALQIGSDADFDNLLEAHRVVLGSILKQQVADSRAGRKLSNLVAPKTLSRSETAALRRLLATTLAHTDTMVQDLLFATPRGA